jgi:hypothetical protein
MDNATFHKGGRRSQLIEGTGCQLLYLPPYSPDLNKIEQCGSRLKSRIRQQLDRFNCLRSGDRGCLAFCVRRRRARLLYNLDAQQLSNPNRVQYSTSVRTQQCCIPTVL